MKTNHTVLSFALAAALTATGLVCSKPGRAILHPLPSELTTEALKVTLDPDGVITANGQTMMLPDFDQVLDQLSPNSAMIWYYRDTDNGVPPPNAMELLQSIVNRKIPIRFSTQPDFSDFTASRWHSR